MRVINIKGPCTGQEGKGEIPGGLIAEFRDRVRQGDACFHSPGERLKPGG